MTVSGRKTFLSRVAASGLLSDPDGAEFMLFMLGMNNELDGLLNETLLIPMLERLLLPAACVTADVN